MARRHRGEGSVYQRADGMWVGSLNLGIGPDGKRRRRNVYGKTQAAVLRKLGQARDAKKKHGTIPTASRTVEAWMDEWLTNVAPNHKDMKPGTLRTYREKSRNYIVEHLGRHRLDKLTPAHVRGLHNWIVTDLGRSPTTAMHAHAVLRVALRDAMRDGLVLRNVASRDYVDAPRKAASDRGALSPPEALAVIRQIGTDRLGSRWLAALLLGNRQGECLGLTWSCVHLEEGIIDLAWQLQRVPYRHGCRGDCGRKRASGCPGRSLDIRADYECRQLDGNLCLIRPKTVKSRHVLPIPPPLSVALAARREAYLAERDGYAVDHDLVWCREDGRPLDPRRDYREWQGHLDAVGIPTPSPLHGTRHTTATLLLAGGTPEHVIQAILGHSDVLTTRGYAHVDVSLARQALDALGERLSIAP